MEILIAPIMVDALLDSSVDLGVALQPNEHPNLEPVQAWRCAFACVMPEGHRLAQLDAVRPADLRGERIITSDPNTPYGQALMRAYGREAVRLNLDLSVRSSTSACWYAQAGAGVAVVDRTVTAGQSFHGLAVRPFHSRERLAVSILRNRYRPMSAVQQAFCEVFDGVWKDAMGRD
jgi:hypothetical protein